MTRNLFSLEGKTIAVIGAGSGIGQACAIGAALQGALVWCLDINADQADATANLIKSDGGKAECGVVDITNESSVRDAIKDAAASLNRLDGLVCTPAINVRKPILKYSGDEFDKVVQVN